MHRWVDITFDCLPLRSVGRMDIPLDASPAYRALCERIKAGLDKHGSHNSYYLYNARCTYHLTNREDLGTIQFRFEGMALTDADDRRTDRCDLQVELTCESCDWLSEPVVKWLAESVSRSVAVEFDRFIEAGDLEKAQDRLNKIRDASDESGGFVGMYL